MNRGLDRFLRTLVPSVPVLARTPLAPILDIADSLIKKQHPEWSLLPPASLRMRIGVGNRILNNHKEFIEAGDRLAKELTDRGYLSPQSHVLDLGCGCGRNAFALKKRLNGSGRYVGMDVDEEMIAWCKANLEDENVLFYHANVYSRVYNPNGLPANTMKLPVEDASISLIFAISLFSHLLYEDTLHYLRDCSRALQQGSVLYMTAFIMDYLKPSLGDRWTFAHKLDGCYVENIKYPEAAVAYDLNVLEKSFAENDLTIEEIYNKNLHQPTIIVRKN